MFKKRGTNTNIKQEEQKKQSNSNEGTFVKRQMNSGGIDLRRDIQQLESNIKHNKAIEKVKLQNQENQQEQQYEQRQSSLTHHHQIPKTKKINKFTNHIMNKLPGMITNNNNNTISLSKSSQEKQSMIIMKQQEFANSVVRTQEKPHNIIRKREQQDTNNNAISITPDGDSKQRQNQLVKPVLSNYGLLDKSHFNSKHNNDQQINQQKSKINQQPSIENTKTTRTHQQALMDYYIKKKMEQLTNKTSNFVSSSNANVSGSNTAITAGQTAATPSTTTKSNTYTLRQRPTQTWQEVLQIQNQYLTQQEKIKFYSIQQVEKKLQKQAQQIIKTEIQKRAIYLKDMLENQFERMEYASKKELKIIKQEKDRIQKQLNSKYRDSGRRHYIDNIKNSVL